MHHRFVALAALLSILSGAPQAQTAGIGSWSEVYNWESTVSVRNPNDNSLLACPPLTNPQGIIGQGNLELEFSHAAVIPTGLYAGWVLLWRRELNVDPTSPNYCVTACSQVTKVVWVLSPFDPALLVAVEFPLASDVFCAGQSWDRLGQLLVAGGVPADCEEGSPLFPAQAYRFRPDALGLISYPVEDPPVFSTFKDPWQQQEDMAIQRYYPTVMPLFRRPSEFSALHVPDPTSGTTIEGGGNMVASGPTQLNYGEGNELWEVIKARPTGAVRWEDPFLPINPDANDAIYGTSTLPTKAGTIQMPSWEKNSPHFYERNTVTTDPNDDIDYYDQYERKSLSAQIPIPDRLFDTYPRMYQMPGGEILVAGDVDVGAAYTINAPGSTWVIDPFYEGDAQQAAWELWTGPSGSSSENLWHDSYYDSVVLLQDEGLLGERRSRVLMLCGSRDDLGIGQWSPNDEVWEFRPSGDPEGPVRKGSWMLKFEGAPSPSNYVALSGGSPFAAFKRVFQNAVILPTGQVFVVGGTSVDGGPAGHGEGAPVHAPPVIYDPGELQNSPGTVYQQPDVFEDPSNPGNFLPVIPRLYHSVAVLLADGRVLFAGGKRLNGTELGDNDARYSGQVFSPPYLDTATTGVSQPVIQSVPSTVTLSDADAGIFNSFEVEASRSTPNAFDGAVLIRPGAVTHHFDNDQRYYELEITDVQLVSSDPQDTVEELTLKVPDVMEIPPGYYMLFVLETDGALDGQGRPLPGHRVPSTAKFVRFK